MENFSNNLKDDPPYQLAYVNGYQQGYYARIDAAEFQNRSSELSESRSAMRERAYPSWLTCQHKQ